MTGAICGRIGVGRRPAPSTVTHGVEEGRRRGFESERAGRGVAPGTFRASPKQRNPKSTILKNPLVQRDRRLADNDFIGHAMRVES